VSELRDDLPTIPPPSDVSTGGLSSGSDPTPSAIDRIYAAADANQTKPGDEIGPFRVIELIGDGGFGAVYLAEQFEPVRRRVALKVIKVGMDSVEVLTRFEAERQALAMIDHPNVARVFDAGVSRTGRPYFAMEYVPGRSITRYCIQENLSISQRLALFIDVCNAVQHAHQKGIIHRDLKPGNILITLIDGEPVPKVIDFGIAKATSESLTDHPLTTSAGRLMGTPEYMSPEQAAGAGSGHADVDTRTDIYSLGVILYELLCGELPFDSQTLRSTGFAGVVKMLAELHPPRPSERLSASAHASDLTMAREVRGDLDWITMKAIEKDRALRYESAASLAMEVKRHLNHEPVLAGPPSAAYRFAKFAKRNRPVLIAASAIVIALLSGLIVAVAGFVTAREERDLAQFHQAAAESAAANALYEKARARASQEDAMNQKVIAQEALRAVEEQRERVIAAKRDLELAQNALLFSAAEDALQRGDLREARRNLLACDPKDRPWEWYAVAAKIDESDLTIYRPNELPGSGVFAADGTLFVGSARITRYAPGQRVAASTFATGRVTNTRDVFRSLAMSPDGTLLAGVRTMGDTIELFDAAKGESIRKINVLRDLTPPKAAGTQTWTQGDVRFTPDGKNIVVSGWVVRMFDVELGRVKLTLPHPVFCRGIAVSPDGSLLATAGNDAKLRIFDLRSGSTVPIRICELPDAAGSLDFHPSGKALAVGYLSSPLVEIFDPAGWTVKATLTAAGADSSRVRYSPDGSMIACSSLRGMLTIWACESGVRLKSLGGHSSVSDLAWNATSTGIATFGMPPSVKVWNVGKLSTVPLSRTSPQRLGYVAASVNTSMLIGLDAAAVPALWRFDAAGSATRVDAPTSSGRKWFVATNASGTLGMVSGPDGSMSVFETADATVVKDFGLHSRPWVGGAISPAGNLLAAVTIEGTMELFALPGGESLGSTQLASSSLVPGSFSHDGSRVAFVTPGTLWIVDAPGAVGSAERNITAVKFEAPEPGGRPSSVGWTPDATRVVALWDNGASGCWNASTGELLWSEPGDRFASAYFGISFTQDGTRALIIGHSGTAGSVKLVDMATGRHVLQWPLDPGDPIMAGAFVRSDAAPGGGLPGQPDSTSTDCIIFTHSSLMRERVSVEGGLRFARRQSLVADAADLFAERMRTTADQKSTPGLLTLYSDLQTVDKKERVFDLVMGDETISDDLKDALIQWLLESPGDGGRGGLSGG
jgi:serine/threonine protein kinase/WD40 repeat protein